MEQRINKETNIHPVTCNRDVCNTKKIIFNSLLTVLLLSILFLINRDNASLFRVIKQHLLLYELSLFFPSAWNIRDWTLHNVTNKIKI